MTSDVELPLTLVDFLLARLAEDWEAVEELAPEDRPRRLAECEAKRRIVVAAKRSARVAGGRFEVWWEVLRLVALPYADHADYRPDWKP